ncbi:MAG: hypothetical protein H7039_10605 [Bryobacteraceae bacterium]|nr:hypothetical protein [Bryobacteraceae bacterium]
MDAAGLPASGEFSGYKASSYVAGKNSWSLAMNPAPGVTGSETARASGSPGGLVAIEWTPTPGSGQGRTAMFASVRAHAATAIAQLIALLPSAGERTSLTRQIIPWASTAGAVQQALDALVGRDGTISFASMEHHAGANFAFGDGSVKFIFQSFWDSVKRDLKLGIYGEDWKTLPGVAAPDARASTRDSISLFRYGSLSGLTSYFISDPATLGSLGKLLAEAEAASVRRDRTAEQAAVQGWLEGIRKAAAAQPAVISPIGADALAAMGGVAYPY